MNKMVNINKKRKIISNIMVGGTVICALITIIPLISIFFYTISKGITNVNLNFFINLPKPVGEPGGGMSNAIVGSLILVGLACLWAIPISILSGVYLAEYGDNKLGTVIRFLADALNGVPSIVIGIFAYAVIVLPMRTFSAIAGAFALGIIMIPSITRITEEMIRMVPRSLREASWALGISQFRTTLSIVLKTAMPGIITGIMLSIARIAGETAPLLFTAFGNRFWHHGLNTPIAALPLQIFVYAISPFEDWHRQAWVGALVLILMVFLISFINRMVMKCQYKFFYMKKKQEFLWKKIIGK